MGLPALGTLLNRSCSQHIFAGTSHSYCIFSLLKETKSMLLASRQTVSEIFWASFDVNRNRDGTKYLVVQHRVLLASINAHQQLLFALQTPICSGLSITGQIKNGCAYLQLDAFYVSTTPAIGFLSGLLSQCYYCPWMIECWAPSGSETLLHAVCVRPKQCIQIFYGPRLYWNDWEIKFMGTKILWNTFCHRKFLYYSLTVNVGQLSHTSPFLYVS